MLTLLSITLEYRCSELWADRWVKTAFDVIHSYSSVLFLYPITSLLSTLFIPPCCEIEILEIAEISLQIGVVCGYLANEKMRPLSHWFMLHFMIKPLI